MQITIDIPNIDELRDKTEKARIKEFKKVMKYISRRLHKNASEGHYSMILGFPDRDYDSRFIDTVIEAIQNVDKRYIITKRNGMKDRTFITISWDDVK